MILIIIFSFSKKNFDKEKNNSTKVIKFMNTVNAYPFDYGEKMFWDNPEEHAIIYENQFEILKQVTRLKKTDSKVFKNYKYCFIIPSKIQNDTVYSDFTLRAWIIKKKGIKTYHYDDTGKLANDLRSVFSFFNNCW